MICLSHTCQRCIMFDSIVEIEVGEVESVFAITPVQHIRSEVGYEEAEAWCEVIGGSDEGAQVFELDVLAIAGEDAWFRYELTWSLSLKGKG